MLSEEVVDRSGLAVRKRWAWNLEDVTPSSFNCTRVHLVEEDLEVFLGEIARLFESCGRAVEALLAFRCGAVNDDVVFTRDEKKLGWDLRGHGALFCVSFWTHALSQRKL